MKNCMAIQKQVYCVPFPLCLQRCLSELWWNDFVLSCVDQNDSLLCYFCVCVYQYFFLENTFKWYTEIPSCVLSHRSKQLFGAVKLWIIFIMERVIHSKLHKWAIYIKTQFIKKSLRDELVKVQWLTTVHCCVLSIVQRLKDFSYKSYHF